MLLCCYHGIIGSYAVVSDQKKKVDLIMLCVISGLFAVFHIVYGFEFLHLKKNCCCQVLLIKYFYYYFFLKLLLYSQIFTLSRYFKWNKKQSHVWKQSRKIKSRQLNSRKKSNLNKQHQAYNQAYVDSAAIECFDFS